MFNWSTLKVQTTLDNLVSLGKLGNRLFSTKSVYWLASEFATTQKATPTPQVSWSSAILCLHVNLHDVGSELVESIKVSDDHLYHQ